MVRHLGQVSVADLEDEALQVQAPRRVLGGHFDRVQAIGPGARVPSVPKGRAPEGGHEQAVHIVARLLDPWHGGGVQVHGADGRARQDALEFRVLA